MQHEKQVQWFPGHMAKTRRLLREQLAQVDLAVELVDARCPLSSRNPEIDRLLRDKPRILLMTKGDQADPAVTARWIRWFAEKGIPAMSADCRSGKGLNAFPGLVRGTLSELIERRRARGLVGQKLRLMAVGIPNVGKSSLINRLAGGKRVRVEDRPGVTRSNTWIPCGDGFELLDTPGVLWPKFEDPAVGERLAFIGSIRDEILDTEALACSLLHYLRNTYPEQLAARYKLKGIDPELSDYDLLCAAAKRRGCLISGGEPDTQRAAGMLLDEFRAGKIGRISLERPDGREAGTDEPQ